MKTRINRNYTSVFAGAVMGLLAVAFLSLAQSAPAQIRKGAVPLPKKSGEKATASRELAASMERANLNLLPAIPAAPANASNYTFTTNTSGSFTDMTGSTLLVGPGSDDVASGVKNLPFDFYMLGVRYSQFSASSNGAIRLGSTNVSTTQYSLGTANAPLIASLVADAMVSTTGKIHSKVTGSAPNRVLTIEFLNMTVIYDGLAISQDCTSQVRLHETTGEIELVYGSMNRNTSPGFQNGMEPQYMGFSGSNTANNYATVNTNNVVNTTGSPTGNQFPLGAPMASLNTPVDGSRRLYSFVPAVPTAPTNLSFTAVTQVGMTLNWTDSPDESLYAIYVSTDGTNYSFSGTAAANAITFAATNLDPSTTYFWRVYAVSDGALSATPLAGSQVTPAAGNLTSAQTGLWADPATWGGSVPAPGDNVTIASGNTVTINSSTALAVTVQSGGILEFEATTARTLTVGQSVTIDSGGIFRTAATATQTGHVLSVGRNLTNNGTLDFSTNGNTAGAGITFTGPSNNTFSGTGATTNVRAITIVKGAQANTLTMSPSSFTVRGVSTGSTNGFLTVTSGTIRISGAFTYSGAVWTAPAYTIPLIGGYWQDNPNFTATAQTGNGALNGLWRLSAGSYTHGTAAANSMVWGNGSTVTVEGGTLNVAGRFGVTNNTGTAVAYTQSAGDITLCTIGCANANTLATFDTGANAGASATLTGGTITLQLASTATNGPRDFRNQAGGQNSSGAGTTLVLGNASSGAAKTFRISGPMDDVVVTNTSANHGAAMFQDDTNAIWYSSLEDLTIQGGAFSLHATGAAAETDLLIVHGDIINNGSIVPGASAGSELSFSGGAVQSYSGTGTAGYIPIVDVELDNATDNLVIDPGVTSNILTNNLNVFSGGVVNANKITVGNGGTTAPFLQVGNFGPALPTGPIVGNIVNNAGSGGLTIYYGSTNGSRTSGGELTNTRSAATIQLDDEDSTHTVTFAGGDVTATTGLLLGNQRLITGANTMIIGPAGSVTRATGYVDGNLKKTFTATGNKVFEVGTANGYSSVSVNATAGTFPADFTAKATQTVQPNIPNPTQALQRYWTLTGTGLTADLIFSYLDPTDIPGTANENNFVIFKYDGALTTPGGTVNAGGNFASISGVSSFSDWTLAEPNPAAPLTASSAVSVVSHGGAGPFSINLPLTGSPGVECRNTSGNYTVVVTFSNDVVSGSASVTAGAGSVSGSPTFSTNTMTINLTGVTDVQQIAVTASNVADVFSQTLPSTVVPMKVLIGDVTGDSNVNAVDVSQVKSVSGQTVNGTNFFADLSADGNLDAVDISLVKSRSGNGLSRPANEKTAR